MFGEFQKLQKICNKMSTRIFKIDGEMPEIIEPKVGNPQNSTSRNWANFGQPWNLHFFEDEIFQLCFQLYAPKVPEWKIAYIEGPKKAQNTMKSPKNEWFKRSYFNPPFWEHPGAETCFFNLRILASLCGAGSINLCKDERFLKCDERLSILSENINLFVPSIAHSFDSIRPFFISQFI